MSAALKIQAETPLLEIAGIHKSFGRIQACRDVGFTLWPGEVLGIVGESGSGKSTLLNILAGRQKADQGRIDYLAGNGHVVDLASVNEAERRRIMRR